MSQLRRYALESLNPNTVGIQPEQIARHQFQIVHHATDRQLLQLPCVLTKVTRQPPPYFPANISVIVPHLKTSNRSRYTTEKNNNDHKDLDGPIVLRLPYVILQTLGGRQAYGRIVSFHLLDLLISQ